MNEVTKVKRSVLYVASTHSHINRFHLPYLRFFKEQGFIVDVIAGGDIMSIPYADKVIPLPFEKSIYSLKNWVMLRDLTKLIKEKRYNVISAHTTLASFFTRFAARKTDTYIINTVHGYLFDNDSPWVRKLLMLLAEKAVAKRTNLLMTMNREDLDIADRYKLCSGSLIDIPGMGVDLSFFRPPSAEEKIKMRKELSLSQTDLVLVYAAEFSARKNQAMLIRALAKLPEQCKLLLLGDGQDLSYCWKLSKKLKLVNRVLFTGHVSNPAQYYKAADIAVSSSRFEGLPFNIMECMSIGLPILASNVKGHKDLIATGKNGYLFPFNDEEAFCQLVLELFERPNLINSMGSESARMSLKYSLESVYPMITAIYSKALSISKQCEPVLELIGESNKYRTFNL